ncbi:MAG: YiiX/YebB-like N1pC/P60 family cysteine hydrolase [Candidatus Sulfotelmatobacter sp.]
MKRIREQAVVIGDIILTTSNNLDSKAIRKFTESDISHSMIYVDPCCVIDATGEGVHARNTQRMFFPENCAIHVLRPKIPLAKMEADIVCNFVRASVGTEYSKREAAATIFGDLNSWSAKQFCSRLVAQAYAAAGRRLVPDPNFCSPEDVKKSALLGEVSEATESVTDHEVERWERDPDMTQMTRDTINAVLDGIRKKDKDIQSMNDVDAHLIEHPEDDADFCEVLKSSGYLTLWKLEMRKNPWQYTVEALRATGWPDEQVESYCRMVLETAENGGKRYHLNKAGYLHLLSEYGLQSFQVLSSLYELLSDLDMQRFQVAKQWLNAAESAS